MAHVEGLQKQMEQLRSDVRDGFSELNTKVDSLVSRSELNLLRERYEERINEAIDGQKKLFRWVYMLAGGALTGGVGINQIIERIFA